MKFKLEVSLDNSSMQYNKDGNKIGEWEVVD